MQLKTGSIIGHVGFGWQANVINLATLGLPGVSVHHVSIVSEYEGRQLVYESTTGERPACCRRGKPCLGVQAHTVDELTALPAFTKLWIYEPRRELYAHEKVRLSCFVESALGLPYDLDGAIGAGGFGFSVLSAFLCGENLSSIFCSELCAAALVATGTIDTDDASKWSPNKLCRHLLRSEKYSITGRLK